MYGGLASRIASRMKQVAVLNKLTTKSSSSSSYSYVPLRLAPRLSRSSSRLPVELSCCLETMMPLHSAIASARLKSSLSVEAKCWGLIPQGISMPL